MRMSLSVNSIRKIFSIKPFYTSPLFMYMGRKSRSTKNIFTKENKILKRHPHAPNCYYTKASFTVEAAVIMPIFLFTCVSVLVFFGIFKTEWDTKVFLSNTARKMAVYGSVLDENFSVDIGVIEVNEKDVELTAMYPVKMPLDFFGLGGMIVTEKAKTHRWVGYNPKEDSTASEEGMVYVTESGVAYHLSLDCTYLKPSISSVSSDEVSDRRNSSGGRYTACPLCKKKCDIYYITNYGERYHSSLTCSGLKRTIRSETKEKAISEGYHACSKCAKGE